MNSYIIEYEHNGAREEAYLYAESFEQAREKLRSLCITSKIDWVLLERIPIKDKDARDLINACGETKAILKRIKK